MTKTPRAAKKLEQARCFLGDLNTENRKVIGKDRAIVDRCVSACLGAVKAAFYRLKKEVGPTFGAKNKAWRETLTEEQRAFFNRM